ncbi:unnamed protein product [Caenorhabditis angaria]|uniref:F-box domain-containing protein n=1 Tax=Caenorhabditis angaria TaxID=860376 RepID=A0A9P1IE72_9PELO|nr:unnamed protein product [Caenorhabditis angaria]
MIDSEEATTSEIERLLPNEIILYIFSFIPPKELVSKVTLVCHKFNKLLENREYWKGKIKSRQNVHLADCELKHSDFDARKSYVAIYEQKERWNNWENQTLKTAFGHSATVDSVVLFNKNSKRFCLSGSRDRSIRLWDIENIERNEDIDGNRWTIGINDNAHQGWIWNIAKDRENDDVFYTTSWDSTVKSWEITESTIREKQNVRVGSAAQCVSCLPETNEIVCTTFAKRVAVIDKRSFAISGEYNVHKRAVIALAVQGNIIYTSGEDRLLVMVDRRNMSKPILLNYCPNAYKSYLSIHNNQLLTATSDGNVSIFSAQKLSILNTYKVGIFTRQVIIYRGAHLVMAKQNRGFKFSVHTPGIRSSPICESSELATEPAKFDYLPSSRTLAIGNGDSSIVFCLPRGSEEQEEEIEVQESQENNV